MIILAIRSKVSSGSLLARIGLFLFELLAMVLMDSGRLVFCCLPLILFTFGEFVQFLSMKKDTGQKFTSSLVLNLLAKLLITLQAVILTLEKDLLIHIDHKLILFIPFWIFYGLTFLAGVAVSFLFISKTLSLCCHQEDPHICNLYLELF